MKLFQLHDVEPVEFEAMRAMIETGFCFRDDAFIAVTKNSKGKIICITNDHTLAQTHVDSGKESSIVDLQIKIH